MTLSLELDSKTEASVRKGLAQSAAGQAVSLGDFTQYANTEDLREELERLFEMKKESERLAKEYKKADEAFRAKLASAGMLNEDFQGLGFVHASVSRTVRFDEALAREVLPAALQKKCEKKVIDTNLVKALAPEFYERCQKDMGGYTVRLSLAD